MQSKIILKKDEVYSLCKFVIQFDEASNCLKVTVEDPRSVILIEPQTINSIKVHGIDYRKIK